MKSMLHHITGTLWGRAVAIIGLLCHAALLPAQELEARVTINHQQVQGTSTSVFENLQTTLEQFLNDRQWTALQFKPNERISCSFTLHVRHAVASLFVCPYAQLPFQVGR